MSKIDRDLAREAALRGRFRRFGFPDPKCVDCGEDRIWRLELVCIAGDKRPKVRRPLCPNCGADRCHDPAREPAMVERFLTAGFPDPGCVVCGEKRIWRLELDHIAGQKHDDACSPLCGNCHADRTFLQSLEPPGGDNPQNVLERIGRWLLGIAEWFELIIEKLYYFGEYLIGLAKQGYGGEFSLPKDD
jgi:hypothetical protein